ncbi:hypothetical protein [Bradyrhizobium archetypum]|uniref:Uncharacterized protein n=1 Tax=Bradyrhizobium archetypum TaxID=2721160 RepID=A0A7Y4H9X0_9BRAD|nr:hypothetical protein [Bradyrhizobium archetypum]NOJ50373.1 hypothetical protein [Bradyrhizobium archetypum]
MSAKLRIKTKGIEIEWEGEVEFLKSEVPDLIASIIQAIGGAGNDENADEVPTTSQTKTFTTASAAAKMQAGSGPELFKIALAKLQISDGIEPASRDKIHDEMKNAARFYNPNMGKNLTQTIEGLLSRGEINEPSSGNYALSHAAYEKFVEKLSS